MLLKRKIERALEWSRHRRLRSEGRNPEQEELDAEVRKHGKGKGELPSIEELRAEELEQLNNARFEKGDVPAMIISAFVTIVPVCIGVIVLICLLVYLFFFH